MTSDPTIFGMTSWTIALFKGIVSNSSFFLSMRDILQQFYPMHILFSHIRTEECDYIWMFQLIYKVFSQSCEHVSVHTDHVLQGFDPDDRQR